MVHYNRGSATAHWAIWIRPLPLIPATPNTVLSETNWHLLLLHPGAEALCIPCAYSMWANSFPHRGGMEVVLADLIAAQQRQGIEAHALVHGTPQPGDPAWLTRVPVQFNVTYAPIALGFRRALSRAIRQPGQTSCTCTCRITLPCGC